MNALAERLRAAAERLAEVEKAATPAPWVLYQTPSREDGTELAWTISRPYGRTCGPEGCEPGCGDTVLVTGAEGCEEDHISADDASLIVYLRDLAPVIASLLRQHAVMAADVVPSEAGRRWHITERCGYSLDPTEGQIGCDCFTDALALTDAILGPVTA